MRHGLLAFDLLDAFRHDGLQQFAGLFPGKPQFFSDQLIFIFILTLSFLFILALSLSAKDYLVNDRADYLSNSEEIAVENALEAAYTTYGAKIYVGIGYDTYYDNYNVETMTIYKADGTKIVKLWFDESGSAFKEDIYDDNGNFLYTEYYNT
jgi:hypothetical protein